MTLTDVRNILHNLGNYEANEEMIAEEVSAKTIFPYSEEKMYFYVRDPS